MPSGRSQHGCVLCVRALPPQSASHHVIQGPDTRCASLLPARSINPTARPHILILQKHPGINASCWAYCVAHSTLCLFIITPQAAPPPARAPHQRPGTRCPAPSPPYMTQQPCVRMMRAGGGWLRTSGEFAAVLYYCSSITYQTCNY